MNDNHSTFDIVLLTDHSDVLFLHKNLGVLKIASELRRAGYSVFVLDHLHIFSFDEIKKILQQVIGSNTLYVGVNTFFYQNVNQSKSPVLAYEKGGVKFGPREIGALLPHGLNLNTEIKTLIKSRNADCKIILGGPDAKDSPAYKIFDYVVKGYGDIAAVNLADHLKNNVALADSYLSIYGPIIINGDRAETYDFVGTLTDYSQEDGILPGETLSLEVSRGCIFRCKFCTYPLNGKKKNDYIKQEEILYQELINNYNKFNTTRYIFSDDTFNDSVEKIQMILRVSKRLPFQLEYWAYIRLDLMIAHPETVDMLYESGLRAAFFGIETMNEQTAKVIGKGGSRRRLMDAIADLKAKFGNKIMLHGSFIFGLPYETIDSMKETKKQLITKEIQLDSWHVYPLRISPKHLTTELYSSDIDLYPEKYNYTLLKDELPDGKNIKWVSDLTSYDEVHELADQANLDGVLTKGCSVSGILSFKIASLGFDLDFSSCKHMADFDWHAVDLQKRKKSAEYKRFIKNKLAARLLPKNS